MHRSWTHLILRPGIILLLHTNWGTIERLSMTRLIIGLGRLKGLDSSWHALSKRGANQLVLWWSESNLASSWFSISFIHNPTCSLCFFNQFLHILQIKKKVNHISPFYFSWPILFSFQFSVMPSTNALVSTSISYRGTITNSEEKKLTLVSQGP